MQQEQKQYLQQKLERENTFGSKKRQYIKFLIGLILIDTKTGFQTKCRQYELAFNSYIRSDLVKESIFVCRSLSKYATMPFIID